ncbi:protein ABHD15 [Daphnia magna]|uniref:protein ABHD15 n=1 Tax=Daphnia magna TaxID=35525 RepID=UPI001E1BA375|nr:protein ABHD15 [Daphnia magna]
METLMEVVLPFISTIFRPFLIVMMGCLLSVALLRLLVFFVLEQGDPVYPSLHYRPSSLSERLISTLPALRAAYTVPGCWTLVTGSWRALLILVATIATQTCTRWTGQVRFLREYLLMEDGGLVSLDWIQLLPRMASPLIPDEIKPSSKFSWVVILMPGQWVCDSKRDLQAVCRSLVHQGHQPVIWNRRGVAGTPLTAMASSSSVCGDLRQVIQYLSVQHPNSPLALVGFSHAASLLISYLGEFGSSTLIHSAIAVSPLWQQPPTGLDWIFSKCKGMPMDSRTVDPLRDSDDIAVPLLVIHYDDDPLVPANTLPRELFTLYPQLILVTCPLGGHCGHLQPTPRLADVVIGDFIHEILAFTSWPLSVIVHQHERQCQQTRRSRAGSLTFSSASRKPRKNHLRYGRSSRSSC